jgi:hypothetical protein
MTFTTLRLNCEEEAAQVQSPYLSFPYTGQVLTAFA